MDPKSLFQSKTFWFNVLTLVVTYGGTLANVLPAEFSQVAIGVVAIANVILRMITTQPVTI